MVPQVRGLCKGPRIDAPMNTSTIINMLRQYLQLRSMQLVFIDPYRASIFAAIYSLVYKR